MTAVIFIYSTVLRSQRSAGHEKICSKAREINSTVYEFFLCEKK